MVAASPLGARGAGRGAQPGPGGSIGLERGCRAGHEVTMAAASPLEARGARHGAAAVCGEEELNV